jgi:hypothetical protein
VPSLRVCRVRSSAKVRTELIDLMMRTYVDWRKLAIISLSIPAGGRQVGGSVASFRRRSRSLGFKPLADQLDRLGTRNPGVSGAWGSHYGTLAVVTTQPVAKNIMQRAMVSD